MALSEGPPGEAGGMKWGAVAVRKGTQKVGAAAEPPSARRWPTARPRCPGSLPPSWRTRGAAGGARGACVPCGRGTDRGGHGERYSRPLPPRTQKASPATPVRPLQNRRGGRPGVLRVPAGPLRPGCQYPKAVPKSAAYRGVFGGRNRCHDRATTGFQRLVSGSVWVRFPPPAPCGKAGGRRWGARSGRLLVAGRACIPLTP